MTYFKRDHKYNYPDEVVVLQSEQYPHLVGCVGEVQDYYENQTDDRPYVVGGFEGYGHVLHFAEHEIELTDAWSKVTPSGPDEGLYWDESYREFPEWDIRRFDILDSVVLFPEMPGPAENYGGLHGVVYDFYYSKRYIGWRYLVLVTVRDFGNGAVETDTLWFEQAELEEDDAEP